MDVASNICRAWAVSHLFQKVFEQVQERSNDLIFPYKYSNALHYFSSTVERSRSIEQFLEPIK